MNFAFTGSRYYLHRLSPYHHNPNPNPNPNPTVATSSSSLQVDVAIHRRVRYNFYVQPFDSPAVLFECLEWSDPVETICLDSHCFFVDNDESPSYQSLSSMLFKLKLRDDVHSSIITELMHMGRRIVMKAKTQGSNTDRKVLPLFAEVLVVRSFVRDERELIETVLRESIEERDSGNCSGMVPARKSEIFKAVKIVRMESDGGDARKPKRRRADDEEEESSGGDESRNCSSCSICLEEMPEGAYVTEMPCSHVFHGLCIVKWLKSSHFCPMCRFEVPTS